MNDLNECVSKCTDGYYGDTVDQICKLCTSPCLTCQNSATNCLSCIDVQLPPTCKVCSDGFYFVPATNLCISCYYKCGKCTAYSNNFSFCSTCSGNRSNFPTCKCPTGFYQPDIPNLFCQPCHSNCRKCSGPLYNQCLECQPN